MPWRKMESNSASQSHVITRCSIHASITSTSTSQELTRAPSHNIIKAPSWDSHKPLPTKLKEYEIRTYFHISMNLYYLPKTILDSPGFRVTISHHFMIQVLWTRLYIYTHTRLFSLPPILNSYILNKDSIPETRSIIKNFVFSSDSADDWW